MADFIDSEAEESEEEQELTEKDRKKLKKVKAIESDDEDDDDEDEERMREELKDLIDDNPIEEDDSDGSDDDGPNRKRKKSDDEDELEEGLDEDDYDLLEDNLGIKLDRKKHFKRLRRIDDEESDDEGEGGGDAREAIATELFEGGSDHDEEGDHTQRSEDVNMEEDDEDEGEYSDDPDDFIVDDDGNPIATKRKKRKPIFTDAALQEAQDIFGVDFDYEEIGKYDEYEDESDEEEDDEYIDEEGTEGEKRRKEKRSRTKKASRKSIFEIYEPEELRRGHFTDLDNQIRNTDIPERIQLRQVPLVKVAKDSPELEEEAKWIFANAFSKGTISQQEGEGRGASKKDPVTTIPKIKKCLEFIRCDLFEVPFIAFYRKEYTQPELNINDLWKIYKHDEKWCQLKSRKEGLARLFEKMQNYQADKLMENINQPLPEDVRVMHNEDITRVNNVSSMEELRDVYQHFILYYGNEIPAMQEATKKKEKARAKEERERKRQERLARRADPENADEEDMDADFVDVEEEPEEDQETENVKQASRNSTYSLCCRANLQGLAARFGLTPTEFAENLRDNYQRNEIEGDEDQEPTVAAEQFINGNFKSADEVLRAVTFMLAVQLSREPLVRSTIRQAYQERAKLTVRPTKKGMKEIDENHPCYSVKYLKDKPVTDLKGDMFLQLCMAEQEKLLTLTLSEDIDGMTTISYLTEMKNLYTKDGFSKNVQEWNTLRTDCVELAYKKFILPQMRTELKEKLLREAKDCVLKACCRKLYNWLKVAPYTVEFPDEDEDDWDTTNGIRILSIAYVTDMDQAAFASVIGPQGECVEFLKLPGLLKRKNSRRDEDRLDKEADIEALRRLMISRKPHLVVIGGESRDATMVQADLQEIVNGLTEDEQFPSIKVDIVDNELGKVYANSKRATSEFRDYPALLRQAISLGRRMQDPLIEFGQLCTPDEEILCLRFHSLQDNIDKEELLEYLYLEFVNRTNEVGVDLNRAMNELSVANLLQFVCGLGPRKAAAIMKTLKQTNHKMENRSQLVTVCHMAPIIFINCAGFLKIDTNSLGDSTEVYVEVLDGSRVHPETYEWARKMAVDALEYDDEELNPAGALEEILESPEKLKDLDLDAFAEELERQGFGNRSITLYDIRAELHHRYKDLRCPYQSPNPEELFDMLTKETPDSFYIGKLITAFVTGITHRKPQGDQLDNANPVKNDDTGLWQCPFCLKNDFSELSDVWNHFDAGGCPGSATGVRLRLDNGISGYIPIKNLSDNHVANPEDRVRRGQVIHCRVTKIEVDRFSIECTSKTSDLSDKNNILRPQKDPYYDSETELKDIQAEQDSKKLRAKQTFVTRVIVHPSFYNISFVEADKKMETMDQGDAIFRPSSKGAEHLTCTWKVTDTICQHIDVRESGKENAFSLGKTLWIEHHEFEDLDEIIARHINPMASFARDLLNFRYYRDFDGGKREVAEKYLAEEREKNKNKIHYFVSASKEFAGKFMLSYQPRMHPRHEFLTVMPEGFRYRKQVFDSLNNLFKWFKEHFRDPTPGTPSTPRGSNRTPFANQTPTLNVGGMDAIHRVAQNLPQHIVHSLSQVATHTPGYPHTPGAAAAFPGYGAFANTPYTPSGQTPYMTPYQTPRYQQAHPTASPQQHHRPSSRSRTDMPPPSSIPMGTPRGTPTSHHGTPTYRSTPTYGSGRPQSSAASVEPSDWKRAAEEWAKAKRNPNAGDSGSWGTPRSEGRSTPRDRGTPRDGRSNSRLGTPHGTPRSVASHTSTPRTINSPHSMVESASGGDATPLYDEN
ncbi:transcription elongation factor SPT6 [Cloeon dipterum]|uniref:transcription elongation factor SPT6 n=1 Tax=Cloeon dipterum TaxID=197152 RepID=UPI0032209401